jgi:hypothetical protein
VYSLTAGTTPKEEYRVKVPKPPRPAPAAPAARPPEEARENGRARLNIETTFRPKGGRPLAGGLFR